MDHSHHSMPGMDPSMPMPSHCQTPMLWNYYTDVCIVFPWWHSHNRQDYWIFSLLVIAGLGVAFEALRFYMRSLDAKIATSLGVNGNGYGGNHRRRASVLPTNSNHGSSSEHRRSDSLNVIGQRNKWITPLPISRRLHLYRSLLYGLIAGLSFFLMLVFMTYKISATISGAIIGHYLFARDFLDQKGIDKSLACH